MHVQPFSACFFVSVPPALSDIHQYSDLQTFLISSAGLCFQTAAATGTKAFESTHAPKHKGFHQRSDDSETYDSTKGVRYKRLKPGNGEVIFPPGGSAVNLTNSILGAGGHRGHLSRQGQTLERMEVENIDHGTNMEVERTEDIHAEMET